VRIWAQADLSTSDLVPISLTATLAVERRRRITFCAPQFQPTPCQNLNGKFQTLTGAFAEILNNMVDLDRFDLRWRDHADQPFRNSRKTTDFQRLRPD